MTVVRLKSCSRCGGDCFPEEDEHGKRWVCLQCGNDAVDIPERQKEDVMPTKVNISELDKQTIMKLPVPPKPDVVGKNKRQGTMLMHDYYEANKEQILAEREVIGDLAVRKRWGILSGTYSGLRRRWGLPMGRRGSKELVGDRIVKKEKAKKPKTPRALVPVGAMDLAELSRLPFLNDHKVVVLNINRKDGLPSLPEWNDGWPEEVKLRWLSIYEERARR